MNVVIIHYNTPLLTEAAVRSLQKHTSCHVCIFDNSDERPFEAVIGGVEVVDNTHGQLIDFDKYLATFQRKVATRNNWGSARHCLSVDYCFDLFPEGFILMDSDVLIKRDISPLWNERYAWVGGVHTNTRRFGYDIVRVVPYLCYLNVPMLKKRGIRYFNPWKMWFLTDKVPDMYYDTGAWLFEACCIHGLEGNTIEPQEYALHFRHGSWREKDAEQWLNENRELWIS